MRDLGVDPMIIRAGPVPVQVAEFEKFRELAERMRQSVGAVTLSIKRFE